MGIVITASHNPPTYNGFKLKSSFGGPNHSKGYRRRGRRLFRGSLDDNYASLDGLLEKGLIRYVDLEEMYYQHVQEGFDIPMIQASGIRSGL